MKRLRHPVTVLAGLVVLASLLRLGGLASAPLWGDEVRTLHVARYELTNLVGTGFTLHPPGYPLLAHFLVRTFDAPWLVRLPALLGGLLGVLVTAAGLHRIGLQRIAPFAGAAVALSVYHAYYSQEARGYSWMSTLVALSALLTIDYLARPSARTLALALLSGAAACGLHYLAGPSVAVLVLVLLVAGAFHHRRAAPRARSPARGELIVWLVFLGLGVLTALLFWNRLQTVFSQAARPSSTALAVGLGFIENVLGRWSGLGAPSGRFVLLLVGLGTVAAFRRSLATGGVLLAATCAPFITFAVLPWPFPFEARYLVAGLLPALILLSLGCELAATLLTRLTTSLTRLPHESTARVVRIAAFLALFGLQLVPALQRIGAPAKYMPHQNTDAFGYRHVVFYSRLDPWIVRSRSARDFETVEHTTGPLTYPIPPWRLEQESGLGDGRWIARYRNDLADDRLVVKIDPWDEEPDGELDGSSSADIRKVRFYYNPFTGEKLARTRLQGRCRASRLRFSLELWSPRLEQAQAYLEQVGRAARCHPE